jgi:hypothetical protein
LQHSAEFTLAIASIAVGPTSLDSSCSTEEDYAMVTDITHDLEEVCRQAGKGIVRDPALLRRIYERTQKEREEIVRKFGVQDIAADIIRQIRTTE